MTTISISAPPLGRPARAFARAGLAAAMAFGALMLAGALAPSAAADDWAVAPAAGSYGSDRENFDYAAAPGDIIQDALAVSNPGATTLNLSLYASDAFTTADGKLDVRTAEEDSTDVGSWLRPALDQVRIPPGQEADVPFILTIPDDATPGDHLGGIITSLNASDGTEQRMALRVHVRVGGDVVTSLAVEDLAVTYSGTPVAGEATITYTIRNTGTLILAARQNVFTTGPFGMFRSERTPIPDAPPLLPGEAWKVSADVPGVVPTGVLAANVELVPLLIDAAGSTSALDTRVDTGTTLAGPWLPLAALLLAALAMTLVLRLRRPRLVSRGGGLKSPTSTDQEQERT